MPPSYKPPKALYKARALEYARLRQSLGPEDWVLHLDEETTVDSYAVKACLNFIERGDRHFGMVSALSFSFKDIGANLTHVRGPFSITVKVTGGIRSSLLEKLAESQRTLVASACPSSSTRGPLQAGSMAHLFS